MLLWDLAAIRPMPAPAPAPRGAPRQPHAAEPEGSKPPAHGRPAQEPDKPGTPAGATGAAGMQLHDVHGAGGAGAGAVLRSSACACAVRQTAVSADARTVLAVTEDGSLWRWDRL